MDVFLECALMPGWAMPTPVGAGEAGMTCEKASWVADAGTALRPASAGTLNNPAPLLPLMALDSVSLRRMS
jgi:hypothetical protein